MKFIDALIPNKKNQLAAVLSLILVILAIPIAGILLQENQDIRQQAASCVEKCPDPKDGVLRSCTPPDSDGSSNDSLCTFKGRVEKCGGRSYCCPSVGGAWTTNMAACPSPTPTKTASPSATLAPSATIAPTTSVSPTLVPTGTTGFLKQDINQDHKVDQADLTILLTNYGVSPLNNVRADMNDDGIVNAIDYAYLLDAFGQTN